MQPREKNVLDINCLRKNANQTTYGKSSDSVDTEPLAMMNQMATAELIKITKPAMTGRSLQNVVIDASELPCTEGLEMRPLKKIRIRECGDLRHWRDEPEAVDESIECA